MLQKFKNQYPDTRTLNKCPGFDATFLIAYGLDYSLRRGDKFEDPDIFNHNLRKQRFMGCGGICSFEKDNNNRNSMPLYLYNFQCDSKSETCEEIAVSEYNPLSSYTFK